jgi:predicted transposase/invertase (TIGR01784 family)
VVRLPIELEKKLLQEVIKIEEEYKMQYVTIWEREAKKEGQVLGEKRGEKRGEEKARVETARELVRYGVDIDIISKSTGLSRDEIEKLVETIQ